MNKNLYDLLKCKNIVDGKLQRQSRKKLGFLIRCLLKPRIVIVKTLENRTKPNHKHINTLNFVITSSINMLYLPWLNKYTMSTYRRTWEHSGQKMWIRFWRTNQKSLYMLFWYIFNNVIVSANGSFTSYMACFNVQTVDANAAKTSSLIAKFLYILKYQ